jgi:uncharacterized SAM-binding protein YcdF (DUF218 family)
MFILKKVLLPFLLPPGIFIISLIFIGMWFLYKKKWKAGIVTLMFGCFAWALSTAPVSDIMVKGLESEYRIPRNVKGDVIILLSGPSKGPFTRIFTAVKLQKRLNIPIILPGVKVSKYSDQKSSIVKHFLVQLGIPSEKIIEEYKSKDTFENVEFTKEICVRLGFKNPILVTSAYHMKRAIMCFEKVNINVTPFPVSYIYRKDIPYEWDSYLPGNFLTASIAIKEYLGIFFYKFND